MHAILRDRYLCGFRSLQWYGSYISQTKYTANGLAEGGLLASGQPLLSDRTLTHLTRSLLFRRWAPLIVRNLKILFEFPG